jgi:gluconate 2-dehydrogenase gamma chain
VAFRSNRRDFLKAATLVPAAAAVPIRMVGNPAAPGPAYFKAEERAFIDAAVARLIPADDLGPGAKEAGVTTFIDRQLSGPYGRAQTWYMQGPWREGIPEQGYQLKLTPAELYRAAIGEIDEYCKRTFGGRVFIGLDGATQDKVLKGLESGDIMLDHAPAKQFFDVLWHNTREGFLADPMYGGNRNFAGWKLIGFPGPRYNYVAEIGEYGKRYALPTVGVLGRDPDRSKA